jgi:subtilase family serine protease
MTSKLAFWRKASVLPLLFSSLGLGCAGAYASDFNVAHGQLMTGAHVPAAVATGLAPRLGVLPAERKLQLSLNLPVRNQDQLDDFLAQLQDPNSPSYHKYLSVAEYTDRFGPTQADYDEVVSWAQANGFTVTETAPNRRLVNVEAPVSVVNKSMHVTMSQYQHPTENRAFFAADREPQVNIGVQLLHVSGLDNFQRPFNHLKANGSHTSQVVAHATGSGPSGEFLPSDMRAAYYGSGSLTGSGQTVAVFSFDGYKASDLTVYKNGTGMAFSTPVTDVLVNGYSGVCDAGDGSGTSTCDDGEQILDIVNVIGMAPGISGILFYEGTSATPILNKMVSDNAAKVLSCSWGGGGFNNTTDDPIYQEMAAQGQTYLNATGDEGAYNSQTWLAPSADPNVLEVGGTDLTTSGAGGAWSSETGWADSGGGFYSGSGSHTPSYQQLAGVITTTNKGSTTYRNDPDVSAEANFDNPTASNGQFLTGYGGTSFAAPRWAGFIALVNQQSVANGHGTVGFVNPAIYNVGVSSSYSSDFHDITSGNNKPSAGSGTGFNAVAGFDLVTGWGSPKGAALITALAGGSTGTADFSLSASPSSLTVAQGNNGASSVTINKVNGFNSSVSFSASGLPTGVTASFNPTSSTTGSTVTFTASSTAATGTKSVTITGTSGSLSHTTTISLTISTTATADFSLSAAPSTLSITQGAAGGTSTITVNKLNGFSSSVSLSASGLPSGVAASFNPTSTTSTSTLTLTASSTATTGTATVTVTGTSGSLSHSTTISLTVNPSGGGSSQLLGNTSFESTASWTASSGVICNAGCSGESAHAGVGFAWMDGYGSTHTDTVSQSVAIPSGKSSATLQYYLHVDTNETTATQKYDTLTVQVLNSSGTVLATLATYSNLNATSGYAVHTNSLAAYIGQNVTIKFTGKEDTSLQTSFVLDDVTLTVQ